MSGNAVERLEPVAHDYAQHLLGRRFAELVLALHRERFGSPTGVAQGVSLDPPPARHALDAAPLDRLAGWTSLAISELAAEDNRRMGRDPLRPSDWRVVRYALTSARTLRQAIAHCADCFEAIDGRCGYMALEARFASAEIVFDARRPERDLAGCLIDLTGLAQMHALFAWLIGRPLPILRARLNQDRATFAALELPALPFPLDLDAGRTGFEIEGAYLDFPVIRSADEIDDKGPGNFLFGAGAPDNGPQSAPDRVREQVLRSLANTSRVPPLGELIEALGCSVATARRRLAAGGTTYRDIVDSCRRELALDLLRRTPESIEVIAVRLDYCDSNAFRRAFRSWTGISPTAYRRNPGPQPTP